MLVSAGVWVGVCPWLRLRLRSDVARAPIALARCSHASQYEATADAGRGALGVDRGHRP